MYPPNVITIKSQGADLLLVVIRYRNVQLFIYCVCVFQVSAGAPLPAEYINEVCTTFLHVYTQIWAVFQENKNVGYDILRLR